MSLDFTVKTGIARKKVSRFGRHIKPRTMAKAVGLKQTAWIDRNFEEEGIEEPWTPLSPVTLRRRRNKSGPVKILQDTGRMKQSFGQSSPVLINNTTVWVGIRGTRSKVAEKHNFGVSNVPKRQILPSKSTARRVALQIIQAIKNKAARDAR